MAALKPPVLAVMAYSGTPAERQALTESIPAALEQSYDHLIVVDGSPQQDVSDTVTFGDNSLSVLTAPRGATRAVMHNTVLEDPDLGIGDNSLIHFVAPTARITSPDTPDAIRSMIRPTTPVGLIGGLIVDRYDRQHPFNFAPHPSLSASIGWLVQAQIHEHLMAGDTASAYAKSEQYRQFLHGYPDIASTTTAKSRVPHQIGWPNEANLAVSARALRQAGLFPPEIGLHEAQVIGPRIDQSTFNGAPKPGRSAAFCPDIKVELSTSIDSQPVQPDDSMVHIATRYIGPQNFVTGQYAKAVL